ncbi:restriction endonuclease subunit S [Stutzerimonas nitrititolerans]|uniref:restriction endonuclease subunit S n=2 Tax=Stutzerimonas TaxID=2901164 RepID=UPI0028AC9CF7|nr:restriction endonuclease subunit S [Stutzerimonas nitrititolerans]
MTNLSGANLNNGAAVGPQGEGRDSPSRFPKYPEYKNSGHEWVGEIPSHWYVYRSKNIFSERNVKALESDEQLTASQKYGVIPQRLFSELEGQKVMQVILGRDILKKAEVNDFVISMRSFQGGLEFCSYSGAVSSAYVPLYANREIDNRFFKHLFKSVSFISALQNTSNLVRDGQALRYNNFVQLSLPFPSLNEQRTIGAFLDHETARIDALIEDQQRLIELLKEKRQAVISHAITKGLDPTVPMKDSGVEWLGEVPAHWKVSKLGHYAQILTGFPFPSASFSHDESDVRLLRGANIGVGSLKWIDTVYWELNEGDELSSYLMTEGQIVLGMDRPWISEGMRIARVTQDDMPCLLLQRVAAITPNAGINDEYLYCLLASELFKAYVEPDLTGVSVPHISPEQILSFQIPVPHIDEQRKISRFIKDQLDQMSALFQQASESVELLQERRAALISAAVTGKIDVRGWQPPVSIQAPKFEVAEAV